MNEVTLSIERADDGITVTMPPAGNRWIIGMGLGLAAPYLLVMLGGSVLVGVMAPPEMRRTAILGAIALNLLFFIVHMLAVATVWLAFYNLGGSETLEVSPAEVAVKRRGMRLTVPIRLRRRGGTDSVHLLDTSLAPGKWPHPRLEVRSGGTAIRFGAGLSAEEAQVVRARVSEVLEAGRAAWTSGPAAFGEPPGRD